MRQIVDIEEIYRPLPRSKVRRRDLGDELQPLDWWLGSSSKPGQIDDDVVGLADSARIHHGLLNSSATRTLYEE